MRLQFLGILAGTAPVKADGLIVGNVPLKLATRISDSRRPFPLRAAAVACKRFAAPPPTEFA